MVRGTIGEGIAVQSIPGDGLWSVHVDPNQLESCLLNLVINARDAMPQGGNVIIETTNAQLDAAYAARHDGVVPGQYVLTAVTDTGTGMAPDVLEHAFEPFFTTKDIGAGSGLGLSQVFGFVKQSGGHLTISSEPGTGTTVKVYLPRHSGESLRAAEDGEASAPVQDLRGRETVLVVEDEADIRSYASEALKDLGYQVIEAHDASSGLAALDAHPEAALLLTDVVLPGMNGRDLALEARRRRPALRVLYTTGDTSNAITESSVVARDAAVLTKPFRIAALASTVRKALDANFASAG